MSGPVDRNLGCCDRQFAGPVAPLDDGTAPQPGRAAYAARSSASTAAPSRGTPASVERAVRYRIPMMLAIIGGPPLQFVPYADHYRRRLAEEGVGPLPVGMHSPGYVAESDEQAREELHDHWMAQRAQIGRERGWPPPTRNEFAQAAGPDGALYVGSPETVARKIARNAAALGVSRFDLKYANGAMRHDQLLRCIELYGTQVAPLVHDMMA